MHCLHLCIALRHNSYLLDTAGVLNKSPGSLPGFLPGECGNISKRTLHHITFARSIVQWVQKERHDDFCMDRIDFRMEIALGIDS